MIIVTIDQTKASEEEKDKLHSLLKIGEYSLEDPMARNIAKDNDINLSIGILNQPAPLGDGLSFKNTDSTLKWFESLSEEERNRIADILDKNSTKILMRRKKTSFRNSELLNRLENGEIIATYKAELYIGDEEAFVSKIEEELSVDDVNRAKEFFRNKGCEIDGTYEKVSTFFEALVAVSLINNLNTSSLDLDFWEIQCKSSLQSFLGKDKTDVYVLVNKDKRGQYHE
jgi:hypothetical protein